MKKVLLFSFIFGLLSLSGCEKNKIVEDNMVGVVDNMALNCPVESVSGPDNSIIGKWKLVKATTDAFSSSPKAIDYSCDNIIYHFRSDGIIEYLVINPLGIPDMNRPYDLRLSPLNESAVEPYTLKIGDVEYACSIGENGRTLKLNGSYMDKDIKYFVRIL